jgi:hypothetical protein
LVLFEPILGSDRPLVAQMARGKASWIKFLEKD